MHTQHKVALPDNPRPKQRKNFQRHRHSQQKLTLPIIHSEQKKKKTISDKIIRSA